MIYVPSCILICFQLLYCANGWSVELRRSAILTKTTLLAQSIPSTSSLEMEADSLMSPTYDLISKEIIDLWNQARERGKHQILIGFAAPPGAGKSTTVTQLCKRIPNAVALPMDGYHYTKARLDSFEDPVEAFKRRGAHWTFDAESFVRDLQQLKETGTGSFPSFDHGIGDPIPDDIIVTAENSIVLVEGNYLLLDISPWSKLNDLLDYCYYIECDYATIERRIIARHISVGRTAEEAKIRFDTNDGMNALQIMDTKERANGVIASK